MTDEQILAVATADGWSHHRTMLYDEEGIEGFRWDGPSGEELTSMTKDGSWSSGPEIPDQLREIYTQRGQCLCNGPLEGYIGPLHYRPAGLIWRGDILQCPKCNGEWKPEPEPEPKPKSSNVQFSEFLQKLLSE